MTPLSAGGARFSAQGCAWFGAGVLAQLDLDPDHCRAVEALDDSMAPQLPAASVTLADFRRREPRDGGVFVIGPEQQPMLRRVVDDAGSWRLEADDPAWSPRALESPDDILGEGIWRSMALPPGPTRRPGSNAGPAVSVTQMQTEGLKPWPVPHREPGDPLHFEPERVAWFETGFLRALGVEPLLAEAVTVHDASMVPTLWPASSVLIDRRLTARRDGAIYELVTDEGFVLRRLIQHGSRWWTVAEDESIVSPRPMRWSDMIIGEAVWTGAFLPGSATS